MRSLLDVNVLIALLDSDHASHRAAFAWFAEHGGEGWASCPITQNGCMRVMSHPAYPSPRSLSELAARLGDAADNGAHEFWPDSVSLLDQKVVDVSRVHGPKQLTDVYLLALAVKNDGRLVTLDAAISLTAVKGATPEQLIRI